MGEVRVPQADQLRLHVPLGGGKLLFQLRDVLVLGAVQQACGMTVHPVARTERLAVAGQILGELLDLVQLLGLHHEESVGDQKSQLDRQIRAVLGHARRHLALHLRDRQRHQELQRVEQL